MKNFKITLAFFIALTLIFPAGFLQAGDTVVATATDPDQMVPVKRVIVPSAEPAVGSDENAQPVHKNATPDPDSPLQFVQVPSATHANSPVLQFSAPILPPTPTHGQRLHSSVINFSVPSLGTFDADRILTTTSGNHSLLVSGTMRVRGYQVVQYYGIEGRYVNLIGRYVNSISSSQDDIVLTIRLSDLSTAAYPDSFRSSVIGSSAISTTVRLMYEGSHAPRGSIYFEYNPSTGILSIYVARNTGGLLLFRTGDIRTIPVSRQQN